MEKYIKEYLLQNKKLKISNFGTFKIVYKHSEIHPILHTLTTPGNYVVFTEDKNLQSDDFVSYVASQGEISEEKANKRIEDWVNKIKKKIENKEDYKLSTLGKFFLNAMEKIEFIPALDTDISPESFGLENFKTDVFSKKEVVKEELALTLESEKKMKSSVKITKKEPEIILEEDENIKKNEQKIEEKPVLKEENTHKPQFPIEITKEDPKIKLEEDKDLKENEEEIKENDTEEIEDGFETKETKKRRKPVLVLLVTLLILVFCSAATIGVAYYFYPQILQNHCRTLYVFIQDKTNKSDKNANNEEVITMTDDFFDEEIILLENHYIQPKMGYTQEISTEEQAETTPPVEPKESVTEPKSAIEKQNVAKSGGYYVVIGSFRESMNAENFLKEKQSEYPNVVNIGQGKTSQLYMIAIGPYTQQEAQQQIENGVNGWLLKK